MNQELRIDNKIKSFTDLNAWKQGQQLVLKVYQVTKEFPASERFGLADQLQRAVVSVTSNLTEGFSRSSFKEKVVFYYTALGSLTEVQNQLLIARDLGYLQKLLFKQLADHSILVNKLINGLIKGAKTMKR